jgi:hypothetical protein
MPGTIGTYTSWTSTGSLASILTEFFLGPLVATLNQEVMALQLFEKASVDWNGRVCTIPVHTGRNTSVEFLGESDTFVTPIGQQQYDHLSVNAHFLYGHFQITGPAIASAKKGSSGALIGWMEAEMTKLVEDVKNSADRNMISGGSCIGFLANRMTPGGAADWTFDGDFGKLTAAMAGGMTQVSISRMDQPGFQSDGTTVQNGFFLDQVTTGIQINSTDENAGEINLNNVNTATSAGAGATATATGFGFPVFLTDLAGGTAFTDSATQPRGVMANLAERSPFGIDKGGTNAAVAGANGRPSLQPLVMSSELDNTTATDQRADITAERIQNVIDSLSVLSGTEPDIILCHPTTRAQYVAMMTQTNSLNTTTRGGATKGDVGFLDLSYQNIPLKYSRHVPRGVMIFLNTKSWKLAELQSGSFADLDGSTLHRTGTTDAYNGFYRWYYNLVATSPNRNAVLCGITL